MMAIGTRPIKLGLTGSIGMGKSTTAAMFAQAGADVWDADAAVHRLYDVGGAAVAGIAGLHPKAVEADAVSRPALKAWITEDPTALPRIEALVHPLVAADRDKFYEQSTAQIVVFDIPLLFENGTETTMDAVAVVSAPPNVQRERVLARPGMTQAQLDLILARQMPDAAKRARADFVITTLDMDCAREQIHQIVDILRAKHA